MNQWIDRKYILQYLALAVLFYFLFSFTSSYYIEDKAASPHPIDSHVLLSRHFFDEGYVAQAKNYGYDHAHYFISFFLPDMVFPLVYTFLFLSIISGIPQKRLHKLLYWFIIAGCVFDYLEDFSFALFLNIKGDGLAAAVAFFTTIKSVLLGINIITCVGCLGYYLLFEKRKLMSGDL